MPRCVGRGQGSARCRSVFSSCSRRCSTTARAAAGRCPPHIGAFIWTADANRFGWSSFLGVPAGSKDAPEGAVPSRRLDLGGLPPTYIGVGSIDLFVSENIEYAARLVTAGVPVELNVVPGAYHVFFAIKPDAEASRHFGASYNRALARAFAAPW